MSTNVMDFALQYDDNGVADLVFENGGFALDLSMKTNLFVDLNTNSSVQDFPIGLRQSSVAVDFGSDLWATIKNARLDTSTISTIIDKINLILQRYVDANVWKTHTVEITSTTSTTITVQIITYNSYGNEQDRYFIPLTKIGD